MYSILKCCTRGRGNKSRVKWPYLRPFNQKGCQMLETVDLKAKKMAKDEYKPVHDELIGKLVVLQQQARSKGMGLVVLVEGWSGAGKGSRISELVYELDARATKVHVTDDIDPKEARRFPGAKWGVAGKNPLMKQFWQALGERGEITFYDRGWYTIAVEQALYGLTKANPKELEKLAKKVKKLPAVPHFGQTLSEVLRSGSQSRRILTAFRAQMPGSSEGRRCAARLVRRPGSYVTGRA